MTPHGLMHTPIYDGSRFVNHADTRDEEITRLKLEIMHLKAIIREARSHANDTANLLKNSGVP